MRILPLLPLLPLVLLAACKTTPKRPEPTEPGGVVTIDPDELEPMRQFVLETRRVLAAEYVRIEASQQFFEQQMGFTRDLRFCERTPVRVLGDGTRVIEIRRKQTGQETNIDPDLLPRVYFGTNGLEVRAYQALRIYLRPVQDKNRPLFLDVQAKNAEGDVKMWVSGRLQHRQPRLRLRSALLWDEERERYVHRSSIG